MCELWLDLRARRSCLPQLPHASRGASSQRGGRARTAGAGQGCSRAWARGAADEAGTRRAEDLGRRDAVGAGVSHADDRPKFVFADKHCPECGEKEVWREDCEGDYYLGPDYYCAACHARGHMWEGWRAYDDFVRMWEAGELT